MTEKPDNPANDTTQAAADAAPAPTDEVAALTKANAELKDQFLRTLADMENLRRRTEREVADARAYGIASFARDVLAVADNIQRALEATGPDWKAKADPAGQALFDGVELTERELLKALEKHGIKKLDPAGQKFDPNLHQAMFEIDDASVPAGTVVQVLQAGFTIGERILRPAMVAVSKGGPKGEKAAAEKASQPN
ncbi:MAG TPA: nucleotide exchange factor GrpE [Xanthobacteraceae bacterium]|nr:nucleotide exchange factor GrpE [Xanthobacteraceae bacterium]